MPCYLIGGLTVSCEFALPASFAPPTSIPDVEMVRGPVPEQLAHPLDQTRRWQRDRDSLLIAWPGIGRALISEGRRIDFAVSAERADDDDGVAGLMPYLLGTAFSILLHQRGQLVLHGAAVAFEGRAQVICAASGTGKSTLVAALARCGCRFITDDLCVIATDGAHPVVQSDGRRLKLWRDAIDHLDMSGQVHGAVLAKQDKFHVDPPARAADDAISLGDIHILRDAEPGADLTLQPLDTLAAMRALTDQTFRPRLARRVAGPDRHFQSILTVLRQSRVFDLTRPRDLSRLMPTAQALLDRWQARSS